MNALLKLLPQPTSDQMAKLATDALVARGFDRAKVRYEADDFQLRVDGNRIWLGNLQAQCRLVWPWQRRAVVLGFLDSVLDKPERRIKRSQRGTCITFAHLSHAALDIRTGIFRIQANRFLKI